MKILFSLICLLLLLVFSSKLSFAQTPSPTPQGKEVEFIKPPDLSNYKDWKKVYFSDFSVYLPQDFKIENIWTVHGGLSGYQDDDFKLRIYQSRYLPNVPSSASNSEKPQERILVIDNDWAFARTYEIKDEEFNYENKLYIFLRNSKTFMSASISLVSKDKQKGKELAEKIFYSIKYEAEPKKEKPKTEIPKKQKEDKKKKPVENSCEKL